MATSERLGYGMVGIKQSGLGREGERNGINGFLERKYVNLGKPG